tara:strand:+ start:88 stop:279 length:192 start_codon:yes stop_codon:yes gene_type:complete
MPDGKLGNMPSGLLMSLLNLSQKHLGQSFNKDKDDGEYLCGIFIDKGLGFILFLGKFLNIIEV